MTQDELGAILGIKKSGVQKIESGQTSNLSAAKLRVLCETFTEFPSYFLYENSDEFWQRVFNYKKSTRAEDIRCFFDNPHIAKIVEEVGSMSHYLLDDLAVLNDEGIRRVLMHASDMAKIKEYRNDS